MVMTLLFHGFSLSSEMEGEGKSTRGDGAALKEC